MTGHDDFDPFDTAGAPSVSFKEKPVGTEYTLKILRKAEMVQQRDFDTNEPDFWPANAGEEPKPKMAAVLEVELDGERHSLWAPKSKKPGSMFSAVADAQRAAGARCLPGGTLTVRLDGLEPNRDPKKSDRKLYKAKYTPPAEGDPFDGGSSATKPTTEEPPF